MIPRSMLRESKVYDVLSGKTTDENLTSENWGLIMNLCDKVMDEGETGCVPHSFSLSVVLILIKSATAHVMSFRRY